MDLQLKNKIAVITGGSVGIGLAVARGLAEEGVHLVLVARNQQRLELEAAKISQDYGVEATAMVADVSKQNDIQELVTQISGKYQGIDILINNAGVGSNEKIMDAPDEKWQYYWDLHVMAAVRLSRGLIPLMKNQGEGVILNNSSICAKQ